MPTSDGASMLDHHEGKPNIDDGKQLQHIDAQALSINVGLVKVILHRLHVEAGLKHVLMRESPHVVKVWAPASQTLIGGIGWVHRCQFLFYEEANVVAPGGVVGLRCMGLEEHLEIVKGFIWDTNDAMVPES